MSWGFQGLAPLLQVRNQLPLLRRAHGQPLSDLRPRPQTPPAMPLGIELTDFDTGGWGTFHGAIMSYPPDHRPTSAKASPR